MSMNTKPERLGNFTSTEIYRLMKNGKKKGEIGSPAYEYVAEKNMERRLGRSIKSETDARELAWGKLCERRVFRLLPMNYILFGDETNVHPEIPFWSGSPDVTRHPAVGDVKCPVSLKSFCNLVDHGNDIDAIRENHRDGEKYYWQIVSNSILTNCNEGELIVYVPYKSELEAIKKLAIDLDQPEFFRFTRCDEEELPYLPDGGHYKNLNIIRFDIPQSDKDAIRERVEEMGKLLITT